MKTHLIVLLLFITQQTFSQNSNSIWCFGDSAGINFSNFNNPLTFASGMDGRGSCASIADSSGNLLFYTFNRMGNADSAAEVYNSNHVLMDNGNSIISTGLYHELLIIPNPGSQKEYLLFSIGIVSSYTQGLVYSKIDMSLDGGLGSVVIKDVRLNNFRNGDCLTAIKHGNGRDWWVFSKYSNINATTNNRTYVYLVTQDSIHNPIVQNFNNSIDCDIQRIIFNSDGSKFMQINPFGFMCEFNFDRCTGLISNPLVIFPEQTIDFTRLFWNGAYSLDNSKFYITTVYYNNDTTRLIQFDLNAPIITNSADTLFEVVTRIQMGDLRLAPDGKIYLATSYFSAIPGGYPYPDSIRFQCNENLSVINFPDSSGNACNFQPYSFYLGGKRAYWGLPNNPNYNLGPLIGSACDTLTRINTIENINWINIFPNPANNYINITYQFKTNEQALFTLYNSMGQEVVRKTLYGTFKSLLLHTNTYNEGMYYYKVVMKNSMVQTGKLVIGRQ